MLTVLAQSSGTGIRAASHTRVLTCSPRAAATAVSRPMVPPDRSEAVTVFPGRSASSSGRKPKQDPTSSTRPAGMSCNACAYTGANSLMGESPWPFAAAGVRQVCRIRARVLP